MFRSTWKTLLLVVAWWAIRPFLWLGKQVKRLTRYVDRRLRSGRR